METLPATTNPAGVLEKVLIGGDLKELSSAERVIYYQKVCDSLGLNPLTKPFDYINLSGKLTLYAKRDCTDQLRKTHKISTKIVSTEQINGVYIVRAKATTPDGREDESTGAVSIDGLKGESLANALMKAETKAKRRVTLSIVGLGMLDETEVESVPGVQPFAEPVNGKVEELIDRPSPGLLAAYQDRVKEARALGIHCNDYTEDISKDELVQYGKNLKAEIARVKAERQ